MRIEMKPTYSTFENPTLRLQLEAAAKHCITVCTFWRGVGSMLKAIFINVFSKLKLFFTIDSNSYDFCLLLCGIWVCELIFLLQWGSDSFCYSGGLPRTAQEK